MYTTDGVVLKKIDSGEADAIFTIYTKEFGKIRAFAQGVKKEGAKLKGHLEPLSLSSVSFVLGRNGERLTHATLINHWPLIRSDLGKLKLAQEIAEAVDKSCFPGQKDEAVWEEIIKGFNFLENSGITADPEFLTSFKRRLSASLGYGAESDIMERWAS